MDYSQAKEMMKLQQEVSKIKKELENTHIEAEAHGLVITVDCEMKIVGVDIEDMSLLQNPETLKTAIKEAGNKGMKKAQEIAAQKMHGVAGKLGINLPTGGFPGM